MVLILTAGTAFVMWLAELITQRGIGQGMSILIFANVVAAIPTGFKAIYEEGGKTKFGIIIIGLARYCSWSSSSWTRGNEESPSRSRDVWSAAECTAAVRRTSRSRSTSPA